MDAMQRALAQARLAAERGEVPVGAVVLAPDGSVLAEDGNRVRAEDAAAHAEMLVLHAAARRLGTPRLMGCDLIVTLEPCAMCAGAASLFRLRRVVFGAYDWKGGGVEHGARVFSHPTCLHRPEVVGGLHEKACAELLRTFFQARRSPAMRP